MTENEKYTVPDEVLKDKYLRMHAGAFTEYLEIHKDDKIPPNVTPKGVMYYKEILCIDEELESTESMISYLKSNRKDYTKHSEKIETLKNYKEKLIEKLHQEALLE